MSLASRTSTINYGVVQFYGSSDGESSVAVLHFNEVVCEEI